MRYAIVGAGSRHAMYREALAEHPIAAGLELVALCDVNAARLRLSASHLGQDAQAVGLYDASEFERMVVEQRPDVVIVTTPDDLHDAYIVKALHAGCDVITEKPMTIDLGRLKRIVDAQRETGNTVTVTFNYRYNPAHTQLKEVLCPAASARSPRWTSGGTWTGCTAPTTSADGIAARTGRAACSCTRPPITSISLNWWVASRPETIAALGKRRFYRPATAAGPRPRRTR